MKIRLFILTFFFSFTNFYCQEIDSLLISAKKTNNDSIIAEAYNKVGFKYIFSDKKKALKIITEGEEFTKKANYKFGFIKLTNTHGIYFDVIGIKDSANYYFSKSLELSIENNFKSLESKCLNNLGMYNWNQGYFNKVLDYFFKSLQLEEELNNELNKANPLSNIGLIYQEMFLTDKALEYHFKALKIREKYNDETKIGLSLNNIAVCYKIMKQYEKAIIYLKKSLEISVKTNDFINQISINDNLGNIYNINKNYELAIKHYLASINISDKKQYKESKKISSYSNLVALYNKINLPKKALFYSDLAFKILKKHPEDIYLASDLHFHSAESFFRIGNYKKGNFLAEKNIRLKDSLFSLNNAKEIANLETKYQTIKKEKEIAIQKEQLLEQELAIKNRNLYAILLASALLILGIIFFAVYKRNQLKKKQLQKEIDLKDALATIKTQNRLQEQRLRISRDLHDNIGSQLTFIISSVDNLKYVSKNANEKLKDKLAGISSFTTETIYELRDTIWAMNKSEITIEDLHTRILSFVEKAKIATENVEFTVNYTINKNEAFSSLEGMNIFRVVQEAVNNSIKYAEASKIEIKIDKKENQFLISVIDNGIGFDINSVELGNGLSNMEKRMSEIGGKLKIISIIEKGTEIKIIL
ncbi:sensor histidine kinase [Polaribacter haliotis]|uniref:histidine kinase n=1 Tax=Polaribacter haliotis TaxID=1888915 RepID=A0A7L8ADV6_9FLAO|nr:sensor histidine kinase [Polaribacter haliotis]QOD60178.1 sensor histidine kinase [Polaribacter haliotis]